MSSSSRDYYNHRNHERDLPPIRDVVGDELARRERHNPYTFGDVRGALPSSVPRGQSGRGDVRGPTLPPIHSGYTASHGAAYHGADSTREGHSTAYASTSQRSGHSGGYSTHGQENPGYTFGVLRTSGTSSRDLVHATPPRPAPHGIIRQTAVPSQTYDHDPEKKHGCDYCGKKFDRPSSLQVHLRTHTGSQPFACEWPGCDRTFSVRSNMLRHWRSHEKNSSSHHQQRHGDDDENDEPEPTSSQYFHTPSSSGQHSASQYYSSSRRK